MKLFGGHNLTEMVRKESCEISLGSTRLSKEMVSHWGRNVVVTTELSVAVKKEIISMSTHIYYYFLLLLIMIIAIPR